MVVRVSNSTVKADGCPHHITNKVRTGKDERDEVKDAHSFLLVGRHFVVNEPGEYHGGKNCGASTKIELILK